MSRKALSVTLSGSWRPRIGLQGEAAKGELMKKKFANSIKEKEKISDLFLVTKKDLALSKAGKQYLNMRVMDRSGEIEARVWDNVEEISENFIKGDVVMVSGYAVSYQGRIQLNINSIKSVDPSSFSLSDFLPSTEYDPEEMMSELDAVIAGIGNKDIKVLLESVFLDEEVRGRFKRAPAAKGMHHPYLGGLLEHVVSLCRIADPVCSNYNGVNRDLVIAGLILHDIGKINELSYDSAFEYTDEGRLIGHITMGVDLIDAKIRKLPCFPQRLAVLIKHIILSHHGVLEFGSPKRPKTVEALIVSFLDDLDAKVNAMTTIKASSDGDENWSGYQRMFERFIYKGDNFLEAEGDVGLSEQKDKAARTEQGGEEEEELELFSTKKQ